MPPRRRRAARARRPRTWKARLRQPRYRSAWDYAPAGSPPSAWRYPVPTRAQWRAVGGPRGEAGRQAVLRNAASRAAQRRTLGSYGVVAPVARRRAGAGSAAAPRRRRYRYQVTGKGRPWRTATSPRRRAAARGRGRG
jgi:hypothetical protein